MLASYREVQSGAEVGGRSINRLSRFEEPNYVLSIGSAPVAMMRSSNACSVSILAGYVVNDNNKKLVRVSASDHQCAIHHRVNHAKSRIDNLCRCARAPGCMNE